MPENRIALHKPLTRRQGPLAPPYGSIRFASVPQNDQKARNTNEGCRTRRCRQVGLAFRVSPCYLGALAQLQAAHEFRHVEANLDRRLNVMAKLVPFGPDCP